MNSDAPNWRNLAAACAAITVFGFAFGLTYPLLSLILESRGVSTDMIGINSAMMPIGILLFSSVIPVASRRFGSRNVAIAAASVTAVLVLSYKVFDTLEAWFIIRLCQGMSISTLFVLSESWIVKFAGDHQRGRVVAIYSAILSLSFGAGPAMVGWIGIHGWTPFVIGCVVILMGILPLMLINEEQTDNPEESTPSNFFSFAPKAPILLLSVAAFAVFDASSLSLLPVYGIQSGLDITASANALTALIIGNVVMQFPIGWLADKLPKRLVIAGCAALTVVFAALLPWSMNSLWMWPVLIMLGSFGYGIYTVSLASLGDRFSGQELVTGASAFAIMWGCGALIGSVSGGVSMDVFGPVGLPGLLGSVYLLLLITMMFRYRQLIKT